jgi:hypothetical protein
MFFSMPIQWYHSLVDPIWPDGTFKLVYALAHTLYSFNLNSLFNSYKCHCSDKSRGQILLIVEALKATTTVSLTYLFVNLREKN